MFFAFQSFAQEITGLSIEYSVCMSSVIEHKIGIENEELFGKGGQVGCGYRCDGYITKLNRLCQLSVTAQEAVCIDLYF